MTDIPAALLPQRVDDFRVGDWLVEPALNRLTCGATAVRRIPPS